MFIDFSDSHSLFKASKQPSLYYGQYWQSFLRNALSFFVDMFLSSFVNFIFVNKIFNFITSFDLSSYGKCPKRHEKATIPIAQISHLTLYYPRIISGAK